MPLYLGTRVHSPAFAALRNRDCAIYLLTTSIVMMCDSVEHIISY